jgi:L-lactate dehydrogenase complex protein LldE
MNTVRRKVQLFATCLIDSLFPEAGEAVVQVLEEAGAVVEFPEDQTCCGQPAYNAGFQDEARRMALHTLDVLEKTSGAVVIPSGSCAGMVKHGYLELFADDPRNLARARLLAERTYELSEFLAGPLAAGGFPSARSIQVAYHPSCHTLRQLGVDRQPKALLEKAGCEVLPLAAECCGFGGLFSVDQADISAEMMDRKLQAIAESGASVVTACDVSCLMHIEGGLRRAGSPVRCAYIAQVLAGQEPGLR